jgi:adenylate cyclase class IV
MPQNIEIKARVPDPDRLHRLAAALADQPPEVLPQVDTFYSVAHGWLKLRTFTPLQGELISYVREPGRAPRSSHYHISPTSDPEGLHRVLSAILPIRGIVRKVRTLYRVGQTRVHVDQVEDLGDFLELEVVLTEHQSKAEGQAIAQHLMISLDVAPECLLCETYLELLESRPRTMRSRPAYMPPRRKES